MATRTAQRIGQRTAVAALLAVGATALSGCTMVYRDPWRTREQRWLAPQPTTVSAEAQRPSLDLSDDEIEEALARGRAAHEEQAARVQEALAVAPARRSLAGLAEDLACCYATGAEAAAADLEAGAHPQLVPFDRADGLVEISSRYARYGESGLLELSVARRPGVTGAVAVAFPPGTLAVADRGAPPLGAYAGAIDDGRDGQSWDHRWTEPEQERRFGHWPPAQDLALLRAPVILLPDGQDQATVTVPVACASFHVGGPEPGQPYVLKRAQDESALTRLLVRLCAEPASEAEAQLAVWLTRDDISWEAFVAQGGAWGRLVTFEQQQTVLPRHAPGAARILLGAGLDPRPLRFFGGEGGGPAIAPPPEPTPAPGPTPEPEVPHVPVTPPDLRA